MEHGIRLSEIVEKMDLKNLTPEVDMIEKEVFIPDVNRPALQLAGFFDHFDSNRVQIIGNVEYTYVQTLTEERREEIYDKLLQHPIPCIVYCRDMEPDKVFLEKAIKYGVPVFKTPKQTSGFTAEIIRWMNVRLAPCISIHGVLVDVYGIGVLIMGESGIGKSEAALELIKRGHRLVTDDVVEIRKVSEETLVGSAPDITKHFIELRGIGIVDVKSMFGVQSVRETQNIDLVITLEEWSRDKVEMYFSSREFLEVVPKGINKGNAVRAYCDMFHIPAANTVAAGDEQNDLPMILAAGVGCAAANAVDEVKAGADYVTENDNNHSAVAEIIRKFMLS